MKKLRNAFRKNDKPSLSSIEKEKIAELLRISPEALEAFEQVYQKLIDEGISQGEAVGEKQARIHMLSDFLSNGGSEADARRMLKVTNEEIEEAKRNMSTK